MIFCLLITQVESIGDAYMVVSGVPEDVQNHAERVGNVALGMRVVTENVVSPFKHKDGTKAVKVGDHTVISYGRLFTEK